jgi:WD repeat-containing protein 45
LDGQLVQELRRGADKAEIFSLCFGKGNKWIACSSDKGTVHVYALKESLSQEFDSAAVRIDEPIPLDASSSGRELTQSYVPQDFSKKEKAIKNPKSM